MAYSLSDALPREIKRVQGIKEQWIALAIEMDQAMPGSAQGMRISMAVMQAQIDVAIAALASGEVTAMLSAYKSLTNYDDAG